MKLTAFLFLVIISINPVISFGQHEITIKAEKTILIKEKYSEKNEGTSIEKIKITIKRDAVPTFDLPLHIKCENITTSKDDYKLINPDIVITKDDFHNEGAEIERFIYLEIRKDSTGKDKGDEVFTITIIPDTSDILSPFSVKKVNLIAVTIIDAKKPISGMDPFRITTGANFDFDKTITATLYFDAQMYKPNLIPICKKSEFGLGFYGSLYNNRYLSQDSILPSEQYTSKIGSGDTVDLVRYNYQVGASNAIKNIGFEGGLIWGWENHKSKDFYSAHTFILPEFSAIHRTTTTTYSYTKINVDTLFNVPTPDSIKYLVEKSFSTSKSDIALLGVGYIGRFRFEKYGEFMLKFTSGLAFQKIQRNIGDYEVFTNYYYSLRVQLLDPKVGINLGGEVRGYYGQGNPFIGVYLSKSFSLQKLTEY